MFGTDQKKEQEGIKLNYSDQFYIIVARAGGSNEHYRKVLEKKLRPYRKLIDMGKLDDDVASRVLREAFVEGVVLGWGSPVLGEGLMPNRPGQDPITFNYENACKLFADLPDLFQDVYKQANDMQLFSTLEDEDDAKN
jgi:hypothetical protein